MIATLRRANMLIPRPRVSAAEAHENAPAECQRRGVRRPQNPRVVDRLRT